MEDAPKGRVVRTIEIDFDNPEQTFLFPVLFHFERWYRRHKIGDLELRLEFFPGIYFLAELSIDDSDLGVFNLEYVDRLIELDKRRRVIDWSAPAAVISRRLLRPVPDAMLEYLLRNSVKHGFDFGALAESFLSFLKEQNKLTLLFNESFGLHSSSGDSVEEFRRVCRDYANAEKAELALDLGRVYERKIEQIAGRLQREAISQGGLNEEINLARVGDLEMACNTLLNKAINLYVVEPRLEPDGTRNPVPFTETLEKEAASLTPSLERHLEDFSQFSTNLINELSDLEEALNTKAHNIISVQVPLAHCTIQLMRVCQVWLPYWLADYTFKGRENSKAIRAF